MNGLRAPLGSIVIAAMAALMSACSDTDPTPTATAAPTQGDCASIGVAAQTASAPQLVLANADVPPGMHQISAGPLTLDKLPKSESDPSRSYEVVYTNAGNTRRVVSEVIVADSAANATQLYDGAVGLIDAQKGKHLARLPLCDGAEISSVTNNGKLVYAVSWHHGNVFAEVVVLDVNTPVKDIISESEALATVMDARITGGAGS